MENAKLTPRQLDVLRALDAWIEEKHYAPTLRELGCVTGIASTSNVDYHLRNLMEKRCIVREPLSARKMYLTDQGRAVLAPSS